MKMISRTFYKAIFDLDDQAFQIGVVKSRGQDRKL